MTIKQKKETRPSTEYNDKIRTAYILLDNIRSTHNVGAIFRTADALGVSKIYCLETTPTPIDRFGRERTDIAKVALGSEKTIGWEYVENSNDAIQLLKKLKKERFTVISLEQASHSIDYKKIKWEGSVLIILGNEVDGVSKELLKLSDLIAEIPMKGKKESLNVSVAAGIFLFRVLDR